MLPSFHSSTTTHMLLFSGSYWVKLAKPTILVCNTDSQRFFSENTDLKTLQRQFQFCWSCAFLSEYIGQKHTNIHKHTHPLHHLEVPGSQIQHHLPTLSKEINICTTKFWELQKLYVLQFKYTIVFITTTKSLMRLNVLVYWQFSASKYSHFVSIFFGTFLPVSFVNKFFVFELPNLNNILKLLLFFLSISGLLFLQIFFLYIKRIVCLLNYFDQMKILWFF